MRASALRDQITFEESEMNPGVLKTTTSSRCTKFDKMLKLAPCYLYGGKLQGLFLDTFLTNQLNWSWQFLSFSEILLEFFQNLS